MLRRIFLAGLLLFPSSAYAQNSLPSRLSIPTFIVSRNAGVADDMSAWTDLLQNDLEATIADLTILPGSKGIKFRPQILTNAPTRQTIENRWNQLNAIEIITALGSRQGNATVFEGSIYLGDWAGSIPTRTVPLPATLNAATYQASRDTVKAALLYALSIDASNNRPAACQLLQRAAQIDRDLVRRRAASAQLSAAIAQRHSTLKCGINR